MTWRKIIVTILLITISFSSGDAQSAKQRSVEVSVETFDTPPKFVFSWPQDLTANGYTVYKKSLEASDWGTPIASLPFDATNFTDTDIEISIGYEYGFFKKEFDLVIDTFCIESGTNLRFKISDMYSKGLCCNFGFGYYELEACGSVQAQGANFEDQEITTFPLCDNGNACEEVIVTILPDMFPNGTSWTLKDEDTGDLLATSGNVGDFLDERPKYGFIYAGINLPTIESRGTILLVIEEGIQSDLTNEINTLKLDFIRDGWRMKSIQVAANDNVPDIRSTIQSIYQQTPDLKAVYLLGNVPVPYSGRIYPDTHDENHEGAWAADSYYGEMNGNWTDETVDITTALFDRNHNVPGDGKFDQDSIPSTLELQVGRVDLSNMDAFALPETELLRNYLNKAHAFKIGEIEVQRRALVDDNFGQAFAAPAASGWRNFAPMFGAENVDEVDYFSTMTNDSYLWSYGCGGGSHVSSDGIGTTTDFANDSLLTVFTMLFGSQFGDWDNSNNFLKAPLAQGLTLTNAWAGNPPWTFHHMAMGYPIGYSTIRTLNSKNGIYLNGPQLVHANLLGDPTLRMHPVKPISDLVITSADNFVDLNWTASIDQDIVGYNIYRTDTLFGIYNRINSDLITSTSFIDNNPSQGENVYMVRAVKLENSGSGSYNNMALGVIDSVNVFLSNDNLINEFSWNVAPNPAYDFLNVIFESEINEEVLVSLTDKTGRLITEEKINLSNRDRLMIDVHDLSSGIYFIKVKNELFTHSKKVVISK